MNLDLKIKLLQQGKISKNSQGFTLVELLVVTIILGILGITALPNTLQQVGKARETEATTFLGTINRAQELYRFEKQTFSKDLNKLAITIQNKYYNYAVDSSSDELTAKHKAIGINNGSNRTRDFVSAVGFQAGSYSQVLCVANSPFIALDYTDVLGTGGSIACNTSKTYEMK